MRKGLLRLRGKARSNEQNKINTERIKMETEDYDYREYMDGALIIDANYDRVVARLKLLGKVDEFNTLIKKYCNRKPGTVTCCIQVRDEKTKQDIWVGFDDNKGFMEVRVENWIYETEDAWETFCEIMERYYNIVGGRIQWLTDTTR